MKKRVLAMVMAAAMVFGVMGCGAVSIDGEKSSSSGSGSTEGESAGNGAIGLAISTLNNPFFVSLSEGAKAAADKAGVELITVDAGDDAAKQTSDVEDLVSKNVSVLIVNPVDSDAIAPAVSDAVEKGVKVISVDRVVNGVEVDCQIASDNVAGAEMATEYLVELIGKGSKAAEIQGTTGASATIDRGEGFHNVADKDLDVTASQTASFNRAEAMAVMENILQSSSDIKGVFAHNDEMALGALEAITSTGKDIQVVGFDATDDAIAAIKAGKMAATIAQQPDKMGETAVNTAVSLINGESVEASIPVEVTLVNKDNVDEY